MGERARGGLVCRACVALLLLAVAAGCGPRLLNLAFPPVDVQAAAPKPPPPPPPPPARVQVTEKMITISERVEFETNSSTILEASHGLLNEVVEVLKKHPDITLVEVQGHTDNTGKAKKNKALSSARAGSVKDYLVGKGIETARLKAVGLGQEKPIESNDTPEGKQKNRRVEFHIIKREAKAK